jgi:hypothetical protein
MSSSPGRPRSHLATVAAIAWLATIIVASFAQGQAPAAKAVGVGKVNAGRLRWMHYHMVAGRITVTSAYQGTNMTFGPAQVDGHIERLQIHINPDQIDFRFELSSADEELTIALAQGNQLAIVHQRAEPKYELRFEQISDGPMELSLDAGEAKQSLGADSFWHLYLAEPEVVRRHLVPLLELLHPAWQLTSMGAAIEDALLGRARNSRQLAAQRWARLVDQLASTKFADREQAQRELQSAGPVVVPYLQSLNRNYLDAEQASRIRGLVESLSVGYEDTPDRIATWLSGDPQVWLSMLSRPELFKRRVAAEQLALLVGAPIAFNPEADETLRKAQIEELKTRQRKSKGEK